MKTLLVIVTMLCISGVKAQDSKASLVHYQLSGDSIFYKIPDTLDTRYIFMGELHPSFRQNDAAYKYMLQKALSEGREVNFVIEGSPSEMRMLSDYAKNPTDTAYDEIWWVDRRTVKYTGWLASKAAMLTTFRKELNSGQLKIIGLDTEHIYWLALQNLYDVFLQSPGVLSKPLDEQLQGVWEQYNNNYKIEDSVFYSLIGSIEQEMLTDSVKYRAMFSDDDYWYVVSEVRSINMERYIETQKRGMYMLAREPKLYDNYKTFLQNQPPSKLNILAMGSDHVHKVSSVYHQEWDPTVARLLRNEDIPSCSVFTIINPKKKRARGWELSKAYRKELVKYSKTVPSIIKVSEISEPQQLNQLYDYLIIMP